MKETKLISIVVPIYKVEAYLDACIESLVSQTYHNLEIILVDDGSPDSCGQICDQWAKKDARICVIHKENGGLSDARNAGIKAAKGDYIGFVDSDDVVHPDMYRALLTLMECTDSTIGCCNLTRDLKMCSDLASYEDAEIRKKCQLFTAVEAIESLLRLETISVTVWNKLYKRETITDIWFPKGKYHEDEFWTYYVLERAKQVVYTEVPYYGYRQREESITTQRYTSRHLDHLDGRALRLVYMEQHYPQFYDLERTNLRLESIRAMQLCLLHMKGEERKQCRQRIKQIVRTYPLRYKSYRYLPVGRRVWCFMSNLTFEGTCRIRNWFHYGP